MTGEARPFVSLGGNSPIHSAGHARHYQFPPGAELFNTHARIC